MRRPSTAIATIAGIAFACSALACRSSPPRPHLTERVAAAQHGLPASDELEASLAGIEAAKAREAAPQLVEEVELRVREQYRDEHQLRLTGRIPLRRPGEIRAQRDVYAADTEIAVSLLEQASLRQRTEACFPSVEALAARERQDLYAAWADKRERLLRYAQERRATGAVDRTRALRFELQTRTQLARREPTPVAEPTTLLPLLPRVGSPKAPLVEDPSQVRAFVEQHHPTVSLHAASASRFGALAARSRARSRPWIRFVDLSYEVRGERERDAVGGQLAFQVPLGGAPRADVGRYEALQRQAGSRARASLTEQIEGAARALEALRFFESRSERWAALASLAQTAEDTAQQWWEARVAQPSAVSGLFDEAHEARVAVVDARERAGEAACSLLVMTGVPLEAWPREAPSEPAP